jgi:general transcription factor 3C polypeptide 4
MLIIGIEWSTQAEFGLSPATNLDGSLLACGNKAGSIFLLRFVIGRLMVQSLIIGVSCNRKSSLNHAITVEVEQGQWVTRLAFAPWAVAELGVTCTLPNDCHKLS